jgi:hypothetical protein
MRRLPARARESEPAHEPPWSLRLGAVLGVMSADLGLTAEIERRLTPRLGVARGFTRTAAHELTLRQDLDFNPIRFGVGARLRF